jgi:hypothetical protein
MRYSQGQKIGTMSECLNIFCFAQDVNIFDSHDVDLYNKYNSNPKVSAYMTYYPPVPNRKRRD